ncbi:MAG TPA: FkbM family methyltransferase [Rhodobacteraceae bacterium]|nr:FkbM family methyltransferase [Paracoccaceae bacterium]
MTDMLEIEGVRIPYDPSVITPKIASSIKKGRYEKDEVNGTPKFIKSDDRVIELGAGIGFISSFISTALGVKNVMCVEADPNLCEFIKRVHAENGITSAEVRNVVALNDAGTPGTAEFYVREQFWSSSLDSDDDYVKAVEVQTVHLSSLIKEFNANTLIVDIEGGERDLFSPLDLTGIDKVFLEIHTRKIKRIGIKMCFDALSKCGFAYDQQVSRGGSVLFRRIPKWQLKAYYGGQG